MSRQNQNKPADKADTALKKPAAPGTANQASGDAVPEIGGRKGLEPTRYGDWEKDGKCVDF